MSNTLKLKFENEKIKQVMPKILKTTFCNFTQLAMNHRNKCCTNILKEEYFPAVKCVLH